MAKKEKSFGFSEDSDETVYHDYLSRPICLNIGATTVLGVLDKIDTEHRWLYFKPSIVGYDGKRVRLEENVPTIISMPLRDNMPVTIRPLQEGDLETSVKVYNEAADKNS